MSPKMQTNLELKLPVFNGRMPFVLPNQAGLLANNTTTTRKLEEANTLKYAMTHASIGWLLKIPRME